MDYLKESDHAFIIRIWQENRDIPNALPRWRGVIQHVMSGDQKVINKLDDILDFISPYLFTKDLKLSKYERFKQWLKAKCYDK